MRSDAINELAAALAKAQGEVVGAEKNANNPHFGSNYADLSSVWAACREAFSKNGLGVAQTIDSDTKGMFLLTTLMHSSGQWMDSRVHLVLTKQDMQGLGSALTYARRYALAAIAGVAQEDDDGNAAGTAAKGKPAQPVKPLDSKPQPSRGPAVGGPVQPITGPGNPSPTQTRHPASGPVIVPKGNPPASPPDRRNELMGLAMANQWQPADVVSYLAQRWHAHKVSDLTAEQYEDMKCLVKTSSAKYALEALVPKHPATGPAVSPEPGSGG